jgi:8-oxo-dGTP pyrophosphatase MutT (NUDIX family)
MLYRHRFAVDQWGYELLGGLVEDGEAPAATAAREALEESGWQPVGEPEPLTATSRSPDRSPHRSRCSCGATPARSGNPLTPTNKVAWSGYPWLRFPRWPAGANCSAPAHSSHSCTT